MRLLYDTHVVMWAQLDPARLRGAREMMDAADERWISAAVVWELAIKAALGKVTISSGATSWTARARRELLATSLDIKAHHAGAVEQLPPIHRDPFDRLMVAQAAAEGLTLLTFDALLGEYGDHVHVIR